MQEAARKSASITAAEEMNPSHSFLSSLAGFSVPFLGPPVLFTTLQVSPLPDVVLSQGFSYDHITLPTLYYILYPDFQNCKIHYYIRCEYKLEQISSV
jgi:hypothetical protein